MIRRRVKVDLEKNICMAFITSAEFCADIIPIYSEMYILSDYIKEIIGWCIEYHTNYAEAPGIHIRDIYKKKEEKIDEDFADLLEDFLSDLSDEYITSPGFNIEFLKNSTVSYFRERSLKILSTDLRVHLQNKEPKLAEELFTSFTLPDKNIDEQIETNLFHDVDAVRESFQESAEPLFKFRGAFGDLTNEFMCKASLIGIMAPEKRGKTFMLVCILLKALAWGNSVAFFGAGDMSRNQMIRRILIAISGISDKSKYCKDVKVPTSAEYIEDEDTEGGQYLDVEYKTIPDVKPLNWKDAWRKAISFRKLMRRGKFRIACYPTDSLNVNTAKSKLKQWKKKYGFEADIVIFDYGDIMAQEPGPSEERHKQNKTWKAFRNLSLSHEYGQPLVIVPTQSDADSYDSPVLKRKNFSEDKRKYAHVTGMFSINQTEEEKEQQVARIGVVLLRDGDFKENTCCTILQCLSKGKFILQSFWKSTEENEK